MIGFYNDELARFNVAHHNADRRAREAAVSGFIDTDTTKISWSDGIKAELIRDKPHVFAESCIAASVYRPFTRQWLYYNRTYNERAYQMPRIFPNAAATNRVMMVKARPVEGGQLALMMNAIPELQTDGGT